MVMSTLDPPSAGNEENSRSAESPEISAEPADRVAALRGAGVNVDTRRLAQVVVGLVLATLAVLVIVLTVAGVHQNQQADRLHNDGVPVTFTMSGCTGLVGGSGSNPVGYVCHGRYTLDGQTYSEQLPGNDYHRTGSTVAAIAVPGDPALVSPAAMVATEHSSSGVFLVPAVLLVILLALVVVILRRRHHTGEGS